MPSAACRASSRSRASPARCDGECAGNLSLRFSLYRCQIRPGLCRTDSQTSAGCAGGWNSFAARSLLNSGRCVSVPGLKLLPSWNTVRLSHVAAFRREATCAPATARPREHSSRWRSSCPCAPTTSRRGTVPGRLVTIASGCSVGRTWAANRYLTTIGCWTGHIIAILTKRARRTGSPPSASPRWTAASTRSPGCGAGRAVARGGRRAWRGAPQPGRPSARGGTAGRLDAEVKRIADARRPRVNLRPSTPPSRRAPDGARSRWRPPRSAVPRTAIEVSKRLSVRGPRSCSRSAARAR